MNFLDKCVHRLGGKPFGWAGGFAYQREFRIFKRRVKFEWRTSDGMGRFGGGWNWQVGIQVGGSTVIFDLLFCSLRIDRKAS